MHITKISVSGFKSYRDLTVVEDLHEGHNVVVGKNGSGKSNFFLAIEFLFNEEYAKLSSKQREAFLHDGSSKTESATIEITFDNADRKLDDQKEEVTISRVITSKKDQYSIDNESATRNDIVDLFDRAEITSSNPYFIVKQGNITHIATAPDSQRLKLLLEVSGTNCFNENNSSWRKEQAKSASTLRELQRYSGEVDKYFLIIKEQKNDYSKFQKLDIERRCLQYAIFNRDLKMNKRKLKEISLRIDEEAPETNELFKKLKKNQESIESSIRDFDKLQNEYESKKEQQEIFHNEEQELKNKDMGLKLQIKDLTDEVIQNESNVERIENDLRLLQQEIEKIDEEALKNSQQAYLKAREKVDKLSLELIKKEQDSRELYEKQHRRSGKCFSLKEDRDEWITKELEQLNEQIKIEEAESKDLTEDLAKHYAKENELRENIYTKIKQEQEAQELMIKNEAEFQQHSREINTKRCERKDLLRQEDETQKILNGLEEEQIKSDKELRKIIGVSAMNGNKSIEIVLRDYPEFSDGCLGLVAENITGVNDQCKKAISLTAGNRLFHYIVDNENTGINILKEMRKRNLPGDVTFLPLNRVQASRSVNDLIEKYSGDNDYHPLLSMIQYDPRFDNVMRSIFGNTLLARNDEAAMKLSGKINCITLGGVQVFRDGSIVGGYSGGKSHLEIFEENMEISNNRAVENDKLEGIRDNMKTVNEQLLDSMNKQQKAQIRIDRNKAKYDELRTDISFLKGKLKSMEEIRHEKEECLAEFNSSLERIRSTKEHLEREIDQNHSSQLLSQDQRRLDELDNEISDLKKKKDVISRKCKEYENDKMRFDDLKDREYTLKKLLDDNSTVNQKNQIKTWESERLNIANQLQKLSDILEELDVKIDKLLNEKTGELKNIKKLESQNEKIENKLKDTQDKVHDLITERRCLEQNIECCNEKIAAIGALPNFDSYSKFDDCSTNQMFHRMSELNIQLEELSNVNKNALNNYNNFDFQRKLMNQRIETAIERNESIMRVIESLEEEKNEAIKGTLRGVNKYFKKIFQKLVANGSAELINTGSQEAFQDDDYIPDELTGIGIRVSFNKENDQMQDLKQFSGGERSVVALAFILAIQKFKPAPFYLFDEVDQALDVERRCAVGEIIRDLSSNAQFISTTFRGELLQHADKCYGVHCQNKVSHITPVSIEAALDFVEKTRD